jgi:haloalkane dehalogenase
MGVLITPDGRFAGLPGYPFEPRYVQVETEGIAPVRMHYVDAGPTDGPVVLLVHGQPTWSYLYRKVIGVLTGAGLRAIAPDNIAQACGDDAGYRELADRYRKMATELGFEGHIAMAEAMT